MKKFLSSLLPNLTNFTLIHKNKTELINKNCGLLLTVSGGQDSILTFFLLLQIFKKEDFRVLYCQHFWQIKNFFSAKFVFELCFLLKIPYTLVLPQIFGLTENESREWRNKNFLRFSQIGLIRTSLTGHTKTDIIEKNLNNLFRGTSSSSFSCFHYLNSQNKLDIYFSSVSFSNCFFFKEKGTKTILPSKKYRKKTQFPLNRNKFKFYKKNINFCLFPEKIHLKKPKTLKKSFFRNKFDEQKFLIKDEMIFFKTNVLKFKKIEQNNLFLEINSFSFWYSNSFSKRQVNAIKPLQLLNRFNVSKLLNLYKLPLLLDLTNFSSVFARNKIRHQIVPFIRILTHQNVENVLTHFFTIIEQEYQDIKKNNQEFYFLFKNLQFKCLIQQISSKKNLNSLNLESKFFLIDYSSNSKLIKQISQPQSRVFTQKLFFQYKTLNLNYLQILKLEKFY